MTKRTGIYIRRLNVSARTTKRV